MKKGVIFTIEAIIALTAIIILIGALANTPTEKLEDLTKTKVIIQAGTALNLGESYILPEKQNYYCLTTMDYDLQTKEYIQRSACGGFE